MPTPSFSHIPVLLPDVLSGLQLKPGDDVIDGTLGGGGHARAMLEATAPDGRLMAIEADPRTLASTREALSDLAGRITFVHANFRQLESYAAEYHFRAVAGALFDLGLSSIALADPDRGFSFQTLGPLDMRFNPEAQTDTAADFVNSASTAELTKIFREYGEERQAEKIAKHIVARRSTHPFVMTDELAQAVAEVKPRRGRIHPATQVFQALRMAVNDELGALREGLDQIFRLLRPNGRLAVITFHSVEDRVVKAWARQQAAAGHATWINKHVITAPHQEVLANPRARSAKLRVIQKN